MPAAVESHWTMDFNPDFGTAYLKWRRLYICGVNWGWGTRSLKEEKSELLVKIVLNLVKLNCVKGMVLGQEVARNTMEIYRTDKIFQT